MTPSTRKKQTEAEVLEATMLQLHGAAMIGGSELRAELGYKTAIAFRVAVSRGKVGVRVFKIPGRKGYWALVKDISVWQATVSASVTPPADTPETSETKSTLKEGRAKPKPLGSK